MRPGIPQRRVSHPGAAACPCTVNDSSTTEIRRQVLKLPPRSWLLGAGYLTLYLLLDWASYVQPLRHTSITPWNPNTGVVMALLLRGGCGRWHPGISRSYTPWRPGIP